MGVPQSGQQAEVEPREWVQGIAQAAQRRAVLPELFADGADHRADARGLGRRNLNQALEASFLRQKLAGAADGFFRREFACPSGTAQEIEQRRIALREYGPCFRSARVNDGVAADEFAGQAEGAGGKLSPSCRLRRESQKIGGGDAGRETALAPGCEPLDRGRVWPALAEGRLPGAVVDALAQALPGAVVDALAQAFKPPLPRQAREGLGDGLEGQVPEVVKPPQPFAAAFDLLADESHGPA